MTRKFWLLIPIVITLGLGIWLVELPVQASSLVQSGDIPAEIQEVEQVVQAELALLSDEKTLFLLGTVGITDTLLSHDGAWAISYMTLHHPDTGELLPTEPGLVISRKMGGTWEVTFPGDANWLAWIEAVPEDLLDGNNKEYWLMTNRMEAVEATEAPLTGYYLPWEGGKVVNLSASVYHDEWVTNLTAHYAFDFYIYNTMFPVVAARSGTVHLIREIQENNDPDPPGNYVVLKDSETGTYQLYLHLAKDTVPDDLLVGDYVHQGDFIGYADDTGPSTGHHLHFMVHRTSSYYWGTSVDIAFNDVKINGGRPRILNDKPYCWDTDICDTFQSSYVSGNIGDNDFPTGNLNTPADWSVVRTSVVLIGGTAADSGIGLKSAQLMALFNDAWYNIGPTFTISPFGFTYDLCKAGVPDGPLVIGLRLVDIAGNITPLADLLHLQKDYACPVASLPVLACVPGANEVALYASAGWQGTCQKFPIGTYTGTGLGAVGDNNTAALQVGANVQATVYVDSDLEGRAETFWQDDGNLDGNLVGADKVSVLQVSYRDLPSVPRLVYPGDGITLPQHASLSLYWENTGGALEYQVQITSLTSMSVITSDWQSDPFWHLGTGLDGLPLETGSYGWQVRARNPSGTGEWTVEKRFTIDSTTLTVPAIKILPFTDSFETDLGWVKTGLWNRTSARPARTGIYTMWYGESLNGDERYYASKSGDLTSPPIQIGAAQTAYLRFAYRYQTETDQRFWDQRWVQISVEGGAFKNLYQLSQDPMNAESVNPDWMLSPYINLSTYAGHIVRLRFHFDNIDNSGAVSDNDYDGWSIDDVSITTTGPGACDNVDAEEGLNLTYNAGTIPAEICAPGDIDVFTFAALQGEEMVADVDAWSLGSPLDAYLFVLDQDGASALAENDDQRSGFFDPLLRFRAPRDGLYHLKLRAWDHGRSGGPEMDYTLSLYTGDVIEPVVTLTAPLDFTWVTGNPLAVTARIQESGSGVDRVEFYWHSSDWLSGYWQKLPDPQQVGDEWITLIDPGSTGIFQVSFYVIAYDNMGLAAADISWNVSVTYDPPFSTYLPAVIR